MFAGTVVQCTVCAVTRSCTVAVCSVELSRPYPLLCLHRSRSTQAPSTICIGCSDVGRRSQLMTFPKCPGRKGSGNTEMCPFLKLTLIWHQIGGNVISIVSIIS